MKRILLIGAIFCISQHIYADQEISVKEQEGIELAAHTRWYNNEFFSQAKGLLALGISAYYVQTSLSLLSTYADDHTSWLNTYPRPDPSFKSFFSKVLFLAAICYAGKAAGEYGAEQLVRAYELKKEVKEASKD